jgi:hypothetical protein
VIELFEKLGPSGADSEAAEATAEGRALRQVLGEIDDIARATLGSITLATMRKLTDRYRNSGRRPTRRSLGSAADSRPENG